MSRLPHFLLCYSFVPDYLDRRPGYRDAHLAYARAAVARGELVLGGALEPADAAVLLFHCAAIEVVERFARDDPYVIAGLVTDWRVRRWTTVVGENAAVHVP